MNRTRITRTLALTATLLLAASLSWAGGGEGKTLRGCLVQLDNEFVLTGADGKQHRITAESGANLDANLGKQVEIRTAAHGHDAASTTTDQAGIPEGEFGDRSDTAAGDTARTGSEGKEGKRVRASSVTATAERCENAAIALVESDSAGMTASTAGTDSTVAGSDVTTETDTTDTARADTDTSATSEQQPDTLGTPEQPADTARADADADVDVDTSTETETTTAEQQPDPMVIPQEPAEGTDTTEETDTARADTDAEADVATGTDPAITDPQEPATDPATDPATADRSADPMTDDAARADTDIAEGQTTDPMATSGQHQLRGCLTRDPSGNYQFTSEDGRSFQLRDDAALLGEYEGKKVTIETSQDSSVTAGTTAPETSATGTATADFGELQVKRINSTGESCDAVPSTPPQQ